MPKRPDSSATVMLALELPVAFPVAAAALHEELRGIFERDLRTIERQLETLSEHSDIERDERSKPYLGPHSDAQRSPRLDWWLRGCGERISWSGACRNP